MHVEYHNVGDSKVGNLHLSDNSTNQDFPSVFLVPQEIFLMLFATFLVPN